MLTCREGVDFEAGDDRRERRFFGVGQSGRGKAWGHGWVGKLILEQTDVCEVRRSVGRRREWERGLRRGGVVEVRQQ